MIPSFLRLDISRRMFSYTGSFSSEKKHSRSPRKVTEEDAHRLLDETF